MSGVDTGRSIQAGPGPVVLGTITVTGKSAGSSTFSIKNVHMNADGGAVMNALVTDAVITVGGSGPAGVADNGGSNAGVAGDQGALPGTGTSQVQGNAFPGPSSGLADQGNPPRDPGTHPVTAPSGGQEPAVSTSPAPVWVGPTGSPRSIPFSPIIGAVLATSLVAVGITLYFVKKGI